MANYRNSSQSTIAANDTSVSLAYRQFFNGGIGVQVTGTWSGTLQFEMSIDGTNFVAVQTQNVNTSVIANTTTANGIFKFDAVGALTVRVRSTAWSSGTATVTIVGMAG